MHSKNDLKRQINEVWRLSLPAILTQITTIAMQYIDSAMVGNLGANASAAIGLVSTSTWLLSGMIYAVSAGFSVQVAHEIGAENDMGARNVVKHDLWAALVVSGLTCLIGVLLSNPLPVWLGGEEALHRDASLYFLVFALTMPFMQLNALTSSYLQCCGDMVTPSVLNAIMCVLDVAFNAVFIPMYGVLRLRREEKTRMDKEILRKAVRIGLPVAVQEIVMCAANVVATMIIAPLGAVAIAANSFAVTAESLCYMPGYGIGSAATTLVGRSIGAGDEKEAKRFGNICTVMGMAFMTVTGLVMMAICPLVFRMLTPDTAVQALAVKVLRIELLAEPLFAASIVAAGALRGTGDTLVPSLMNLGSIWIVRIGLALLLVGPLGLTGMWIAMAVELCVRGLLMLYRQKTSKYYKVSNKTAENA